MLRIVTQMCVHTEDNDDITLEVRINENSSASQCVLIGGKRGLYS